MGRIKIKWNININSDYGKIYVAICLITWYLFKF